LSRIRVGVVVRVSVVTSEMITLWCKVPTTDMFSVISCKSPQCLMTNPLTFPLQNMTEFDICPSSFTLRSVFISINEDGQILKSITRKKRQCIGHVSRHYRLFHEIVEGRMSCKPTGGRRRIQMLHDLANDDSYITLKRAAEDREGWRHGVRLSETCCAAEDY